MLLVLDAESGKEVANVKIDGDADDISYDSKRKRVYISCGAGFVDVMDADNYKLLEKIPTAGGARTSLFVPELDCLCVAVPHRGSQPAEMRVYKPNE